MCGYPSDPEISEYWIIYREVGVKNYGKIKYSKNEIINSQTVLEK